MYIKRLTKLETHNMSKSNHQDLARWFTRTQTVTHPSTNPAVHDRESNSRPVDHKSDALTTTPPSHLRVWHITYIYRVGQKTKPAKIRRLTFLAHPVYSGSCHRHAWVVSVLCLVNYFVLSCYYCSNNYYCYLVIVLFRGDFTHLMPRMRWIIQLDSYYVRRSARIII